LICVTHKDQKVHHELFSRRARVVDSFPQHHACQEALKSSRMHRQQQSSAYE